MWIREKKVQKFGNQKKQFKIDSAHKKNEAEETFSQILHKFADLTSLKSHQKSGEKNNHEPSLSGVSFGEF